MKKTLVAALALALVLPAAGAAVAKPFPKGGVTAAEVAATLKANGLPAEITTDGEGDPMIKSSSDDLDWRVYFYNCDDGRCKSIQFSAGFDLDKGLTYARINEWNYTKRFSRGALDDEMDPYIRYDIDAESGFTSEALTLAVETWQMVLPAFSEFVGYSE